MVAIPPPSNELAALIDAHHEAQQEEPRPHLGASLLGHPCDRFLFLVFRWAVVEHFPGRVLRLFRRGSLEEPQVLADLRAVGVQIRDASRVRFGKHVSGTPDGLIDGGVPEAQKARHVLEIKTHNRKSFETLLKDGVEKVKPQHWAQMQVYMLGTGIDRALYYAVCKDDDRIYIERVRLDKGAAQRLVERGQSIALSDRMPPPISEDPSWYQCKWCPAHSFCHEKKPTQHVNCRTCAHSTATPQSTFTCERHGNHEIPEDWQRKGCESHVVHPDMVPWPLVGLGSTDHIACYEIDGKRVLNGEPDMESETPVFASSELLSNPTACASGNETLYEVRRLFKGKIGPCESNQGTTSGGR